MDVKEHVEHLVRWFSNELPRFLPKDSPPKLLDAIEYSVMAGGKRLRPILLFSALESLGKRRELGLEAAAAIEMLHTYSLIHDDLPAMDNDDYRRGRLTNHKVFGEGMAILAGDALLTWAFYLLASLPHYHSEISLETSLTLVRELAMAAGPYGMVAGQVLDMEAEHHQLPLSELEKIHTHKTGDLIHFSVFAGAYLGGADDSQMKGFSIYARKLGLAFQVQDDILNVIGDEKKMGKRVGSDQERGKNTYPALMGIEKAKDLVRQLVAEAKEAIHRKGIETEVLFYLADYVIERER